MQKRLSVMTLGCFFWRSFFNRKELEGFAKTAVGILSQEAGLGLFFQLCVRNPTS